MTAPAERRGAAAAPVRGGAWQGPFTGLAVRLCDAATCAHAVCCPARAKACPTVSRTSFCRLYVLSFEIATCSPPRWFLTLHGAGRPLGVPAQPRAAPSPYRASTSVSSHGRMVPVGTEPYRAFLGLLLVWQAMITWRLQSQAVPEPGATTMRFRYPGLPLAPVVLPPSQQAAVSALAQAASGLVLATGKWTASAACASLAVLAHLLLLDQSLYQNHYWLLCNVLLCFAVAADRPRTLLALLRFTHGLPYVFGALAKLTVDWLLRQEPATRWCGRMRGVSWLPDPLPACCPAAMSIGGLAIDALMVPLLLLPSRHRTWAHLLALAFHLSNALLFHIGIFPFVMLASHLLWMEPALGPRPAVDPHRPLTERRAGASDISQPT